uniref:Peptidase C48, SUMO/sentrin/Ubl1 n=1 Tax=Tanacetum cinerariifolium TaxID=118510 RepID=A0A6L2KTP7_TANCI|nr:peptidase C48, SUMO/sentrin/Ubl1 [Tanacetum cinerariifolium]
MHTTQDLEELTHQEFETGATDDQPVEEAALHSHCNLAKKADSRTSFNELMDTPVDFSTFVMNRLKVDTLTPKLLAGPTYKLMKGSCKSLVELEFFLEETIWRQSDKDRASTMIQAIDKQDCDGIPKRPTMYLNIWSYKAVKHSDEVLKLKNFKKDELLKLFKLSNPERMKVIFKEPNIPEYHSSSSTESDDDDDNNSRVGDDNEKENNLQYIDEENDEKGVSQSEDELMKDENTECCEKKDEEETRTSKKVKLNNEEGSQPTFDLGASPTYEKMKILSEKKKKMRLKSKYVNKTMDPAIELTEDEKLLGRSIFSTKEEEEMNIQSLAPGLEIDTSVINVYVSILNYEENFKMTNMKRHFFYTSMMVKEYQEKDKIGSKPNKNGKRGEAGKSQKQLQGREQEKLKKMQKEGLEIDFYEFTDELIPFISPPEYDCFLFKVEPNSRDFTKDVVEDISPIKKPQVLNDLPTHPTLQLNMKFQPSSESLFTYVVWIFLPFLVYSVAPHYLLSLRNEDTIFDLGICNSNLSRPDISHRCGTVTKFNTHRSHLNKCPMLINGQNNPPLDVLLFHFYPS